MEKMNAPIADWKFCNSVLLMEIDRRRRTGVFHPEIVLHSPLSRATLPNLREPVCHCSLINFFFPACTPLGERSTLVRKLFFSREEKN